MKFSLALTTGLLLLAAASCAPKFKGPTLYEVCEENGCFPPLTPEGLYKGPSASDGVIRLKPEESFFVKAEEADGTLQAFARVKESAGAPPPGVIWVRFGTGAARYLDVEGNVLTIKNVSAPPFKYRVGMRLSVGGPFYYTSSCPVPAGETSYEHWPHEIKELVLVDFQVLTPGEIPYTACE